MEVQAAAMATVCNILLDFSPMKKLAFENGVASQIILQTRSMDTTVRLNSVWALKNLLYMTETNIKQAILNELTCESLFK